MKIKPYEKNAKKHPKKQLNQLAKVVKEVGWRQPVVVNQHGVIVVGHGRWETYEKNKESLKEIWVIDDTGKTIMGAPETMPLTKDQEMMWRLADNKLNESDWDMSLVTEELKLLSPEMIDLSGFKRDIILQSAEDEYDIENGLKNEVRIEKGDVWKLGNHRLMCGDSTKKGDVERLMDGEKADMVFTDPPYNTGMTGESQGDGKLRRGDGKKSGSTWLNHMFNDSYTEEEWEGFMELFTARLSESMKDDSVAYVCLDWRRNYELIPHLKEHFHLSNTIVWDKVVHGLGSDYKYTYELINVCKKGKPILDTHQGEEAEYSDVWHIQRKMGKDEDHATKKPIELITRPIRHACSLDGIVLDIFGGSGSTLIACEQTGRKCYMMELDPKYCTVILDRWEKLTGKKAEKIWQDQL